MADLQPLDVEALLAWWHSDPRPEPALAFTSGNERLAADLMLRAARPAPKPDECSRCGIEDCRAGREGLSLLCKRCERPAPDAEALRLAQWLEDWAEKDYGKYRDPNPGTKMRAIAARLGGESK